MINLKSATKEEIQKNKKAPHIAVTLLGTHHIHYQSRGHTRMDKTHLPCHASPSPAWEGASVPCTVWSDLWMSCACELAQATFSHRQADLNCHINPQS